ncbi:MAG: hypothetical protein ACXWW4_16130, partial [Candidatus Binatia bacterium]
MIKLAISFVLLITIPSPASAQTMAQIVEGAKAEKELLTYATTQAPVMNRLVQGFNKKYPFIKVEYYRAGAEKIAQRFDTEAAAGRHV